ncbi:MAG TPA: ABC transporter permease [Thermoplasmata archaeon]|nr:ABC transporter permease [Thermoplasmata archaeon]
MATADVPGAVADRPAPRLVVPSSAHQVLKLTRYQLREYLLSRRFVILLGIVAAIGAIITGVVAHFRGALIATNLPFYATFWGTGAGFTVVLAAVFFGGDAIAGEFQNRTGYFLMGLPIRRATVYIGKYIAAFLASTAVLLLFLAILVGNGFYYFGAGAVPWQLGLSLVLAVVYLAAVLGATFMFSSLFKTSAYGFVLTAILFLFGFTLLQDLIQGLVKIEPWMVISYAQGTIGNAFSTSIPWGITGQTTTIGTPVGGGRVAETTIYTPGIAEGVVIMLAYFLLTAIAGLLLFEREEFS